jgi:hypothetical protein
MSNSINKFEIINVAKENISYLGYCFKHLILFDLTIILYLILSKMDIDSKPINQIHDSKPINQIHDSKPINQIHDSKPINQIHDSKPINQIHDSNIGLKNATYKKTQLCGDAIRFNIPMYEELYAPSMPEHPFYTYHDKKFCKDRLIYSTVPLHIGSYDIPFETIKQDIINVLRCPIKNARTDTSTGGNREIVLPIELAFLKDYILYCCIYETSFNKRFDDLWIHITVDYNPMIKKGSTQRIPGFHVDGFQGSKFPEKHEIEHSYLWSCSETNNCGTEFCVQPFFISHIDESKYLIFHELEKQARESNIIKTIEKNVYIFDPYMVHRSPVTNYDTSRLIVRITMEYQKLLDPNDTVNPALPHCAPYKYDIRNRLCEYAIPLNKKMYGYDNIIFNQQ